MRYKTLPAHPKWLNLALFLHAGRVLYRSHHQEAEQGEFCTEREAETGLANTTAHQAPPVWRAPEGPEGTGGLRGTEPGRGAGCGRSTGPAWVGGASARQISHIISHGHFSRPPKNVAIPTMQIQYLKKLQGNYVRNCCADGPGRGTGGRRRGRQAAAGPGRASRRDTETTPHTHFAHNFPRSLLEIAQKRCNSNDMNSIFEALAGELRAKLLSDRAWPGFETTHTPISDTSPTGVEGAGGSGGHGRASRSTTPSL